MQPFGKKLFEILITSKVVPWITFCFVVISVKYSYRHQELLHHFPIPKLTLNKWAMAKMLMKDKHHNQATFLLTLLKTIPVWSIYCSQCRHTPTDVDRNLEWYTVFQHPCERWYLFLILCMTPWCYTSSPAHLLTTNEPFARCHIFHHTNTTVMSAFGLLIRLIWQSGILHSLHVHRFISEHSKDVTTLLKYLRALPNFCDWIGNAPVRLNNATIILHLLLLHLRFYCWVSHLSNSSVHPSVDCQSKSALFRYQGQLLPIHHPHQNHVMLCFHMTTTSPSIPLLHIYDRCP